jgi:predicted GNAT superfamily acetyltransferase
VIEIPADVNALSLENAIEWRQRTRRAFTEALEAGYVVRDFYRDGENGIYILGR